MVKTSHSHPSRGRDRELALLSERLVALRGGRGSTVVVAGMAGSGKSRLPPEAERTDGDDLIFRHDQIRAAIRAGVPATAVPATAVPATAVPAGRREAAALAGDRRWSLLTATELMVVEKVAAGATNRQVAEALFLSPHTVGSHLRHAFTKLDIHSRVELARLVTLRLISGPADAAPET